MQVQWVDEYGHFWAGRISNPDSSEQLKQCSFLDAMSYKVLNLQRNYAYDPSQKQEIKYSCIAWTDEGPVEEIHVVKVAGIELEPIESGIKSTLY